MITLMGLSQVRLRLASANIVIYGYMVTPKGIFQVRISLASDNTVISTKGNISGKTPHGPSQFSGIHSV